MVEKTFRVRKGLDVEGPNRDSSIIDGVLTLGTIGNISGASTSILSINSLGSVHVNLDTNANDTNSVFKIREDSTDFFVMDNDGQVGIGTSSPSQKLDVAGSINLTGDMYLGSAKAIYFDSTDTFIKTNADDPEDLVIGADQDVFIRPDNDVIFEIGTTEYVRFDGSTQRVGIGTSSPQSLLDVRGAAGSPGILTLSTDELTVVDGDKLGRIDFNAPSESSDDDARLVGASIWAEADATFDTTHNTTELVFATANTAAAAEQMRLTHDGKLGIGTSTPSYDLHVVGDIYATDNLRVGNTSPSKIALNGNDAFVEGQFEASGSAGSYIYSLALGTASPTASSAGKFETSGDVKAGSMTIGGHTFDDIDIGTEFVDTDDHIMSSGAIKEKILSYNYLSSVDISANTNLAVSSPITLTGDTVGLDDPVNLTELTESTDATDDKILLWDESASSWKYMTLDNLQDSIDTSSSGGASSLDGLTDVLVSNDSLFINNFGSAPVTGTLSTASDNIGIGDTALNSITSGDDNIGLGREALTGITTGGSNIAIGALAGNATTSAINNAVFIGGGAGKRMDGDDNIAIGRDALKGSSTNTNNTGANNVGIGYLALFDITSADRNVAIGYAPLQNATTGGYNVAIGNNTLGSITTGSGNVAIGSSTADLLTDGVSNVAIGAAMGDVDTGVDYNVALGYRAGRYLGSGDNVAIGKDALVGSSTATDNTGTRNVAIGKEAMDAFTSGSDNVAIGFHAAGAVTSGGNHVAIGREALSTVTSNSANTAVGYQAGKNLSGSGNVAFGPQALLGLTSGTINGEYNIAMGYQPMWEMQTGDKNLAIGFEAMQMIRTGNSNIAVGNETMKEVYDSADHNITLGYQAGYYIGNNDNVAIGYRAMKGSTNAQGNTGSKNIAIGYTAMESYTTGEDNVAIGRNALGDVTTGDNNIAIGEGALSTTDVAASDNIMMGYFAGAALKGGFNIGIGSNAVNGSITTSNNTGTQNVGIGHFTLSEITSGDNNVAIGNTALQNVSSGNGNIGIGQDAGDSITDGSFNVLIGEDAGQDITSGDDNLIIHAGDNSANAPLSTTADRQLRISSGSHVWFYGYDGNLYLGRNHLQKLPSSGTDTAGTALEIGGGAGTGTGTGGDLKLQYAPAAGSTGSSVNSHADALTVHGDTGNVTVHNNLIVSGDSITVNAETITTEEAMLSMGIGQTATDADALDFGFYGTYDVGDTQKFRGVFADASDSGKFKFFKDLQAEPTTTVNTAGTGYAAATVVAATFEGNLTGNVTGNVTGNLTGNATGAHSGTLAGNASTATTATNVVVSANNSTDETIFPVFVDGETGTQGLETDTGFTYNPSTGMLTATGFTGALTGNADTATSATTAGGLSSTLAVSSGGTGATTLTSNAVLTGNGTGAVQAESNFTYDSNTLTVKGNDGVTALTDDPIVLVRPILTNSRDATVKIQGARNGSTSANTATLIFANEDDNLSDANQFNHLGAIVGRVSDTTDNHGDMHFLTFSDGATANDTMTLAGTGNVGIGTTSPDEILHISSASHPAIRITGTDNANADPAIEMLGQGNNYNEGFQMWYDNGLGIAHIASLYNNSAADIHFHTRVAADRSTSNVRMVIEGDGNVGIGTTAPDQKLHVEGSILADAYNFATTTLASDYTDGETSLVLTDASQFPTAGSGTIDGVAFTWTNKSSNTLTVPDLNASYTAASTITVVADTGLFFRDGFENVAQPSVTIYDKDNSGASRDDLSINANAGIRFRLGNESQMQLTADKLSLTTGNQGAHAIFGFRDRVDMGLKSNTSFAVGMMAPDNVYINIDSNNNNADNTAFIVAKNSNLVGSGTELFRVGEDGKVGIGTASPRSLLDVRGAAGSPGHLSLSTAETTVVDGDILGRIDFIAPDEADGAGDSTALAASIYAEADATFSDTVNTTDIVFATGSSEAATEKMRLLSTGQIELSGTTTGAPADTNHVRLGFESEVLRIDSFDGYVQVGCQNTTYCHFVTNRGKFYFNRELVVNEGVISSYDEDLILRRINNDTDEQITIADNSQTFTTGGSDVMSLTSSQVTIDGSLTLKERASAPSDTAGFGQLWVKSDGDGELYFTDDNGTDIQLTDDGAATGGGGGGGAVSAVANGSNNRIATFSSADALNGEANLTFDGSTLALAGKQTITVDDTVSEAFKVTITDTDSTADSTPFVVDGNGRVGIGTASPMTDMALTLNGDGTSYEGIGFQVGGNNRWKLQTDSSAFYFDSQVNTLDYNLRLRDSSGNFNTMNINADTAGTIKMGLGVSPVALLHVKADSSATSQTSAGSANITIEQDGTGDAALNFLLTGVRRWTMGIDNSDSDKFKIQTGATSLDGTSHVPAMTITAAGDVGIGTTSPSYTLHVMDEDARIIAEDGSSGIQGGIKVGDNAGNVGTFTNSNFNIVSNDTARIHVASDGDIGVGTTSPSFASGSGIEVSNATQANLRLTDSNGGSTDFAVQGNDAYILNRHASGKIIIKPGNGDDSIELASSGQVKFNNAYTFPTSDGSANQVLTTNGSGALSFADAGGSSGADMKKFVAIQNTGTGDATTLINVNNTTAQAITWLSEVHKDSIFTHSTSSSPEEITVTSDGTYLIDYSINTENTGTNRFVGHARLYVNGTALNYTLATSYSRGAGFDDDMVAHWSGVVELSANDVVTVKMRKNDADDTSQVQVQQDGTYISLLKVGGQATNTFVIVGEESDDYISSEAAAGNANGFVMSYGNGAQNTSKSSSGSDFGVVIPAGCTLSRIDITFGNIGSETNSNNQTLTVFKNRSASTTTMTYNASGSGGNAFVKSFSSLSGNGLSYAAGDTFNIRATGMNGYTNTQVGPARMTAYFTVD